MATVITNSAQITQYCREKQVNEAALARDVYMNFERPGVLSNVRQTVHTALGAMVSGAPGPVTAAIAAEPALDVWRTIGPKTHHGLKLLHFDQTKFNGLTPSDCSDLIRLIGAWVEKGGLIGAGAGGTTNTAWENNLHTGASIKEAYRPGVHTDKVSTENVWGDKKERFKDVAVARRDRGPGRPIEDHIRPYMRDPNAFSGMGGTPAEPQKGKRPQNESSVLKLDRLFGLIQACDISGTTADTMFALEAWGGSYLTATYYMLPLATIVHNNHHSLIEVALAMSLNGIISYEVGFYSTLLPKGRVPKEMEGIDRTLAAAEHNVRNRHFVAYYVSADPDPAGLVEFTPQEVAGLRTRRFWHSVDLVDAALVMPRFPSAGSVRDLCQKFGVQVQLA
jgi:hypothetical protein